MTKQYDNYADLITFTRASTGTYLDSDGLLKTATTNTPRIEYDADGNRLGLLIEEARTNLIPDSIPNAGWSIGNTTLTPNAALAPDGTTTASEFNLSVGGFVYDIATVVASTTYTASWYIKAGTATSWVYAFFNENTASFINRVRYSITDGKDVGNGWYRFSVQITTPVGCTGLRVYPLREQDAVGTVVGATGTSFLWGVQLEAGSFPTSYIPTSGSTATRSADVASIPTSAFGYNPDKGTVVVGFERNQNAVSAFPVQFSAAGGNAIELAGGFGNPRQQRFDVRNNGATVSQIVLTDSIETGRFYKLAGAFAKDDFAGFIDGTLAGTDTSGDVPIADFTVLLGRTATGAHLNGHIKSIQYYPRRLTNAQLQRLTT